MDSEPLSPQVVPFVVTYNGMATGSALKRCVEYLMADAPAFGAAIGRMELYPHCQTRDPTLAGLEWMDARFQARLATLPFVRFRRKLRLFEVAFASSWIHSEAMFGPTVVELSSGEFACLCREFAAALLLTRLRVKRTDAFDVDGLEAYMQRRLGMLPWLPENPPSCHPAP